MTAGPPFEARKFKVFGAKDIEKLPQLRLLDEEVRESINVLAQVLPFRINSYVLDLIDWNQVPSDPIFQLVFPQKGMLSDTQFATIQHLVRTDAPKERIKSAVRDIQFQLNPHPAGQMELNVPSENGEKIAGIQHKYKETLLFFPAQGQTCHAYCTYCFRWAQFVGIEDLKFASREAETLKNYVMGHPEVKSVLFTGGDPMVMKTRVLEQYIDPLLQSDCESLNSIRIGTKSPAYWPYRFVTDPDADNLLRLFERVVASGKNLALMAHFSHPRELSTPIAEEAIRRIRSTGAVIRCQAPIVKHVNDSSQVWRDMWTKQVSLGAIPYYMFVERDTGPSKYFEIPLERIYNIFRDAYASVSGLARTVRGPSMSCSPGKVHVLGVQDVGDEKAYVLQFLQARNPELVGRPFFAEFDPQATWFDDLVPLNHSDKPFFSSLTSEQEQWEHLEV